MDYSNRNQRRSAAPRTGIINTQYDIWGNIVGGTNVNDRIEGGNYDENGRYAGGGQMIRDRTPYVPPTPAKTGLDRLKSGESTPGLNAFQARQPAQVRQAARAAEVKTARDAQVKRDVWNNRRTDRSGWSDTVAQVQGQPVKGANAFMQNKLDVARAKVQMESRGELASQRYDKIQSQIADRQSGVSAVREAVANASDPAAHGITQTAKTPHGTVSVRKGPAPVQVAGTPPVQPPGSNMPAMLSPSQLGVPAVATVKPSAFSTPAPAVATSLQETQGQKVAQAQPAPAAPPVNAGDAQPQQDQAYVSPDDQKSVATYPDEARKRKNAFGTQSFSLS